MQKDNTYQVKPTTFTYGGETLARLPDGRAVFIPYVLPGEEVRIQLTEHKERYARGGAVEVLETSPDRIKAKCIHFGECGGCHYQHMPYAWQLEAKKDILCDQLERIGGLSDPPVQDTVPSPYPWHYRNHVQFHLSEEGALGYKAFRSNRVIPIQECHLPEEVIDAIWPLLDLDYIPGLDRVILRSGEKEEDVLLVLESSEPEPIEFEVDLPISAVYRGPDGQVILSGDEFTVVDVKGFPFAVSAGSFFQINTPLTELIVDHLFDILSLSEEKVLLDVYCGVGLFSAFFAPEVRRVVGIESSSSAVDDYMHNLSAFENVELYEAQAEEVLPHLDLQPDIILVDPPRAGLAPEALDGILALGPQQVVYVSCDPATLGRDVKRFNKGGYKLVQSTPFDMFPQTYHIESVNLFRRA
jgi:23S rRNA (uracil1939-C5)-methyltransferase